MKHSKAILVYCMFIFSVLARATESDTSLGTEKTRCDKAGAPSHVWILKQWHLPPNIDTKAKPDSEVPQKQNQKAIYQQIAKWVANAEVSTVFAEGCMGEIDNNFKPRFNGRDIESLKAETSKKNFDEIGTLVPLKIEAKFGDKVKTLCVDDEKLMKEYSLAFSNARGTIGFLSRLAEYRFNPDKLKLYFEKAKEIYKLPSTATPDEAIKALKVDLKKSIEQINHGIATRNQKFVDTIKKTAAKDAALVIGGLHAAGVMDLLKKDGFDCTVVQPIGYSLDEEKLLSDLNAFLNK